MERGCFESDRRTTRIYFLTWHKDGTFDSINRGKIVVSKIINQAPAIIGWGFFIFVCKPHLAEAVLKQRSSQCPGATIAGWGLFNSLEDCYARTLSNMPTLR